MLIIYISMTKVSWFILILLIVLIFSMYISRNYNLPIPKHMECKESLFEYVVFNKCTYREDGFNNYSSGPA